MDSQGTRARALITETSRSTEELRSLTTRQRDVLALLAQGQTDLQIAEALELRVSTVRTHVSNVLRRLKVENRVRAAVLWDRQTRGYGGPSARRGPGGETWGTAREESPAVKIPLTGREREVLALLARGYSNQKIAQMLSIEKKTAAFHVGNVLRKLRARNRTEAVVRAIQQGCLDATYLPSTLQVEESAKEPGRNTGKNHQE